MTSRLKKKLDNMGMDLSSGSSKLTESFCLIGTPLPPLEKTRDTGEFQPVWNQDVREEKGRRRLHGAFTGGFSAGYFNTVGSKEGWTPSTFVSSRAARASQKGARPEDFMDEEDKADLRDSQKLVDTDAAGNLIERAAVTDVNDLTSALQNLIPPIEESSGARLLRKMGWRPGQGVGPRISFEKLSLQDAQDGRSLPPGDPTDSEARKHTFAPRDTKVPFYRAKAESFGLGFLRGPGLQGMALDDDATSKREPKISAGFGLGALNDAEEDDLDVYDNGHQAHTSRRLVFEADQDEDSNITIGPTSKKNSRTSTNKSIGPVSSFHDGRPATNGFVVCARPEIADQWFALPDIPQGWKPTPTRVWASDSLQVRSSPSAPLPPHSAPALKTTGLPLPGTIADQRGALLGETPLPVAAQSVFDYLSSKDRERLRALTMKSRQAPEGSQLPASTAVALSVDDLPESFPSDIPTLHPSVAKAAMSGFQPFTTDPAKQERYDAFLRYHASPSSGLPYITRQPHQTNEEFTKELNDFAKAAMIFKPATGAMADRFRSAVTLDVKSQIPEGLHVPTFEPQVEEISGEPTKLEEEDPKKHAAKMGMYGQLTRETSNWQPSRLLCKRFAVPDPGVTPMPDAPSKNPRGSEGEHASPDVSRRPPIPSGSERIHPGGQDALAPMGRKDISNIGLGEDESQGKDTLTYQRPSMDIFKAIFASDNESESEDEVDAAKLAHASLNQRELATKENVGERSDRTDHLPMDIDSNRDEGGISRLFKPTFKPRSEREGGSAKDLDLQGSSKRTEKREKKKKTAKPLVSFGADDEGNDTFAINPTAEKKRRREKDSRFPRPGEPEKADTSKHEEDEQWVEKEITSISPKPSIIGHLVDDVHPPKRMRKTAADFL